MRSGYDGEIKIDTKIDTSGFNAGMDEVADSAKKGTEDVMRVWGELSHEEQIEALIHAAELYGAAWDKMSNAARDDALSGIINTVKELPEAAVAASAGLDKVGNATKRLKVTGHGLSRILFAMIPGTYRLRRAAVGFTEIGLQINGAETAAKGFSKSLGKMKILAVAIPALLIAAFALLARAMVRWAKKTIDALYNSLSTASAFRDKVVEMKTAFDNVKGAVQALGGTILLALAPAINKIINWLVKAINFISMFIASWAGQKTVMQYVSGEVEAAADSAERLAKNTGDATKAAEGALAAFDEIDVLQMEKPETGTAGAAAGVGGAVVMKEVEVPTDFAKTTWEKFKEWLKELWEGFWEEVVKFAEKWGPKLGEIFVSAGEWIKEAWHNVGEFIKKWATIAGDWIAERITKALDWIEKRAAMFKEYWGGVFNSIANWAREKAAMFKEYWGNAFENIKFIFSNAWNYIQGLWGYASTWFRTRVIDPIRNAFATVWQTIRTSAETAFTGIKNFVKDRINNIIDFLNKMISSVVLGINTILGALNNLPSVTIFGKTYGGWNIAPMIAPEIPRLATGAVIPPNSAFAAIVGDQRSGTNIETPEALLRQIVQEESGSREATVRFAGTIGEFVRKLKPYIDKENTRIGTSLVQRSSS